MPIHLFFSIICLAWLLPGEQIKVVRSNKEANLFILVKFLLKHARIILPL